MVSSTGVRIGDDKGYPVTKRAKITKPKHRKGVRLATLFPGTSPLPATNASVRLCVPSPSTKFLPSRSCTPRWRLRAAWCARWPG
eukprot:scaffold1809_cov228-Pinguiococcus_pyrenoidosus.AAC.21